VNNIIDENRYFGFADVGLIEEYNLNFLTLKKGEFANFDYCPLLK